MPLLELKNVSITYGGAPAVQGVSFAIEAGDFMGLLGANGSGKSTLLKGILGIQPVSAGCVVWGIKREETAYMPQANMAERDFPATAGEIVLSGTQKTHTRPFYSAQHKKDAQAAMQRLDIMALAGRRIGTLSGGQQQRVFLARALAKNPKLLIMDEPCAGLDPEIMHEFYRHIYRLNREEGLTVLMATHDTDAVEHYANRAITLHKDCDYPGCGAPRHNGFKERERHGESV